MSNICPFPPRVTRASREVTLSNPNGLHARPAMEFVRHVLRFKSIVTIRANGREFQADRIIDVVLAELNYGDTFLLDVEGPDALVALDRLCHFLNSLKELEKNSRGFRRQRIEALD